MATESDLRDLLRGPEPGGRSAIDLDAVLRRSRSRRRPRLIAAQALGSVALVGALGTAVVVSLPPSPTGVFIVAEGAGGEADSAPQADDSALRATYDACGEELVTPTPVGWGLGVSAASGVDLGEPALEITLNNLGPLEQSGVADVVSLAFFEDGVVVAHGIPVEPLATRVDLAAGESFVWHTAVVIESCGPDPTLAPGRYDARAVVEFVHADSDGIAEPVRGAITTLDVH